MVDSRSLDSSSLLVHRDERETHARKLPSHLYSPLSSLLFCILNAERHRLYYFQFPFYFTDTFPKFLFDLRSFRRQTTTVLFSRVPPRNHSCKTRSMVLVNTGEYGALGKRTAQLASFAFFETHKSVVATTLQTWTILVYVLLFRMQAESI